MKTHYIFHYDLENPEWCLKAAPVLARWHEKHEIPATFFILGTTLEQKGPELKAILGANPLFDVQSHTYSHRQLRDNKMHGPGVSLEDLRLEVERGKQLVEEVFERPCIGIRAGCGFYCGMQGEAERLQVIADCGAKFISTDLRGPHESLPGGLSQAYWYDEEGFPNLLELPGHGWHDLVLRTANWGYPPLAWPSLLAWGIPNRPVATPEEECAVQRVWIDKASDLQLDFISPVYHPHSIYRFSNDCRIIDLLMRYIKEREMPTTTYRALYERYATDPSTAPGRSSWSWEAQKQQVLAAPLQTG